MSVDRYEKLREQWSRIRAQWNGTPRLRLAAMIMVVFAGLHVLSALDNQRSRLSDQYEEDLQLRERMELLAAQSEWEGRADEAEAALLALQRQLLQVSSAGQAQAEARSWLTELAEAQALEGTTIKLESVLDVPGHPQLLQVLARLDGKLPEFGHMGLLRNLSRALPWVQVEKLELGSLNKTARVSMVVRFYYRRAGDQTAGASQESTL